MDPLLYSSEGSLGGLFGTSTDATNVLENVVETSGNILQTNVAYAGVDTTHLKDATVPIYYSLWFWVAILVITIITGSYASRTSK